jgi:hypothetical protein
MLNHFLDSWEDRTSSLKENDLSLRYQKLSMDPKDIPFLLKKVDDKVERKYFLPKCPTSIMNVEKS